MSSYFDKVLIANRGEIALRILTTLQDHNIKSVVTASDVDKQSVVAKRADEILYLPGITAIDTYLNMDLIVEKAVEMGVDAIHPGYGFLSENSSFAQKVLDAGITFIGPLPEQMDQFGDKLKARNLAIKTNTPLIKGTTSEMSDEELIEMAKSIGFPLLIKASAGGGGRGIRLVNSIDELHSQIINARNEARLAFNDDRIYIEKFVANGRHIEVQIVGDGEGNVIHFNERDCTIQRKNQKLIEEAPATLITRKKASEIHDAAVKLTSEIKYKNAGTVEFLYDPKSQEFYFLEVNARIQVEHPVTELITNEDLIWRQIQVAAGEGIGVKQNDIKIKGHAIEARIYAENPYQNFNPSPGTITRIRHPIGAGVRVDSAIEDNSVITPYYDSMISKLIVKAIDRPSAIRKLSNTLSNYLVSGVHTTIPYIKQIINTDFFRNNDYHTKLLDTYKITIPDKILNYARAIAALQVGHNKIVQDTVVEKRSNWRLSGLPNWR